MPDLGQILVGIAVFVAAWMFSLVYISVFYHRALAHNAIALSPGVKRWILVSGNWVTGIDPVGWVAMHRQHHAHADGALDPHSPSKVGVLGVAYAQLKSYERVLSRLARGHRSTVATVADLDCGISWTNRRGVWWLPYVAHAVVALSLGLATGLWFVAICYWAGIIEPPGPGLGGQCPGTSLRQPQLRHPRRLDQQLAGGAARHGRRPPEQPPRLPGIGSILDAVLRTRLRLRRGPRSLRGRSHSDQKGAPDPTGVRDSNHPRT